VTGPAASRRRHTGPVSLWATAPWGSRWGSRGRRDRRASCR
jgi:hypothetical protein